MLQRPKLRARGHYLLRLITGQLQIAREHFDRRVIEVDQATVVVAARQIRASDPELVGHRRVAPCQLARLLTPAAGPPPPRDRLRLPRPPPRPLAPAPTAQVPGRTPRRVAETPAPCLRPPPRSPPPCRTRRTR